MGSSGTPAARPAGIPNRSRTGVIDRGLEKSAKLVFVLRRHDDHVRKDAEIGQIERAVMRRAVLPHEAGSVQGEDHRKVLETDVVDDLVVSPLEKSGIDGHDRLQSARGETRGERHPVLFGDPHVEEPLRKLAGERGEPVPSAMAAVIATIDWSCRARSTMA